MANSSGHGHAAKQPHATGTEAAAEAHFEAAHPSWVTYVLVGVLLTILTIIEVSAYYIPAWETSRVYVPSMLILSSIKFIVVVLFYMHLKYDHRIFRALFTGPFIIAIITIVALLFLFGQLAIRFGGAA